MCCKVCCFLLLNYIMYHFVLHHSVLHCDVIHCTVELFCIVPHSFSSCDVLNCLHWVVQLHLSMQCLALFEIATRYSCSTFYSHTQWHRVLYVLLCVLTTLWMVFFFFFFEISSRPNSAVLKYNFDALAVARQQLSWNRDECMSLGSFFLLFHLYLYLFFHQSLSHTDCVENKFRMTWSIYLQFSSFTCWPSKCSVMDFRLQYNSAV